MKPTEIAKLIKDISKVEVHTSLIQPVKEIKSIGKFKVLINLHSDVQSSITIKVVQEESN